MGGCSVDKWMNTRSERDKWVVNKMDGGEEWKQ